MPDNRETLFELDVNQYCRIFIVKENGQHTLAVEDGSMSFAESPIKVEWLKQMISAIEADNA